MGRWRKVEVIIHDTHEQDRIVAGVSVCRCGGIMCTAYSRLLSCNLLHAHDGPHYDDDEHVFWDSK